MTYKSAIKILVMLGAILGWLTSIARADTLDDIRKKGSIIIGVRADRPPFGFRDPAGHLVGMEFDLANDIAKRIGVNAKFDTVGPSNRLQYLEQSKIDLMIATMAVNDERKAAVGVIEPYYYASGVAALSANSANIKSSADLKDKTICAILGAIYINDVQKLAGKETLTFKTVPLAEKALQEGKCVGFVYDDVTLIYKKKSDEKWKDFTVVQLDNTPMPWGMAVKLEEKDTAFGKLLSEAITDWHKQGTLVELEKKWLGQNTEWLLHQKK